MCTTLPHSSNSRIHHVRARCESSLCCVELLLSSLPSVTPPYRIFLFVLPLRGCSTILPPSSSRAPSISSLQLYARVSAVVVGDCFDRSVPFVTPPYINIYIYIIILFGGIRSGVFCRLSLSMRFSELEFSIKPLRSSAVFGGRLKRPSPCRIRSAHGRDRVRGLSETSEKCANLYFGRYTPEIFLDLGIYRA